MPVSRYYARCSRDHVNVDCEPLGWHSVNASTSNHWQDAMTSTGSHGQGVMTSTGNHQQGEIISKH